MFILKKILNSATNAPDPLRLPIRSGSFKTGTLITLDGGFATNTSFAQMPTHIAGETTSATKSQTLLCYELTPDLIFKVAIDGDPSELKVGDKIAICTDGTYAYKVMCDTAEGVATIVDLCGAKNHGDHIYVKFE